MRRVKEVTNRISAVLLMGVMLVSLLVGVPAGEMKSVEAATTEDGFSYTVLEDGTIEITGYSEIETEVVIPSVIDGKAVTSIGYSAFFWCADITSIVIPEGVISIGKEAFQSCDKLVNIEMPSTLTSIGTKAFCGCESLKSIEIPSNVTSIGENVFIWCYALESIVVDSNNPIYDSRQIANAIIETSTDTLIAGCKATTIPTDVIRIGEDAFYAMELTSIQIPHGVTSIGSSAFMYCEELTSVEIPDSVTSIEDNAFYACSGLTSVEIPNSVTSMGVSVFSDCTRLTSINIPNSISYIADGTFNNCAGLVSIEIPNNVTSIGNSAFRACTKLRSINISDSVTSIGEWAFSSCTSIKNIEIPNNVTSIGNSAFNRCTELTSIKIPDGVTNISDGMFYYCEELKSVEMPTSISSIGEVSFKDCYMLTSIEIPNNVTYIGEYAFDGCFGLKNIRVPNSVVNIDNRAFSNCTGLESIVIPSSVMTMGYSVLWECPLTMIVYADEGSVAATYAIENGFTVKPISEYPNEDDDSGIEDDEIDTPSTEETTVPMSSFDKSIVSKLDVGEYMKGVDLGKDKIHGPTLRIMGKDIELFNIDAQIKLGWKGDDIVTYSQDVDEKTVEVLIGVESRDGKVDFSDEANSNGYWKETYSQVKSIYTGLRKGKSTAKLDKKFRSLRKKLHDTNSTLLVKGEVNSVIFLKYSYASGELELIEGGGIISAGLSSKWEKPLPNFPLGYVTVGATGEGSLSFTVEPEWSGELGVDVGIRVGLGLGVKKAKTYIEGGVKATLENRISIPASSIEDALAVNLNGKGFLEASVFGFTTGEISKDFVNLSLYPEIELQTASTFTDESDLQAAIVAEPARYTTSTTSEETTSTATEETTSTDFEKLNLYPHCSPVLADLGEGTYLLVWVDDNGTKDTYNRTSLMYSYFDGSVWSTPTVVAESAYLNDYPSIYAKDGVAYVLWQQLTQTCDENTTYEEILSYSDLYYTTFVDGTFSTPVAVTSDNTVYEMQQQVYVTADSVYAVWVENSANDPFMGEGETNAIYTKELTGETAEPTMIADELSVVSNIEVGEVGEKLVVGYEDDITLYLCKDGETELWGTEEDTFTNFQIVNGTMYVVMNGNLCVMEDDSITDLGMVINGDYTVLSDGTRIVCNEDLGGTSQLVSYSQIDGVWNRGVNLTDGTKYIRDYQLVENSDGTLTVAYCEVDVDLTADDVYGTANLYVQGLSAKPDLELLDTVYTEVENPLPGEELTFYYELANNGDNTINSFTVSLVDSEGNTIGEEYYEMEFESGTSYEFYSTFTMPDTIERETYSLKVSTSEDEVSDNNAIDIEMGYGDLALEECTISDDGVLTGKLTNDGYSAVEGIVLNLYKGSVDTTAVKEVSFETIAAGSSEEISIALNASDLATSKGILGTTWIIEVDSDSEEASYGNNSCTVFVYRDLELSLDTSLEMIKGATSKLTFEDKLTGEDFADKVVWSSKDESVVTVTELGELTAVGEGTAEVSVTFGEEVYTCIVTVKSQSSKDDLAENNPSNNNQNTSDGTIKEEDNTTSEEPVSVSKISISGISKKLAAGKKVKLTATITPSNASNKKVKWTSSNKKYATVNQKGQVTLKKKGAGKTVKITATATDGSNKKATYKIKIMKHAVKKVTITGKKSRTIKAGKTLKLKTKVTTTGKSVNKKIKWTTSNKKYATVTQSGKVKTKKAGKGKTVKITAMATDGSGKKAVVRLKLK